MKCIETEICWLHLTAPVDPLNSHLVRDKYIYIEMCWLYGNMKHSAKFTNKFFFNSIFSGIFFLHTSHPGSHLERQFQGLSKYFI